MVESFSFAAVNQIKHLPFLPFATNARPDDGFTRLHVVIQRNEYSCNW